MNFEEKMFDILKAEIAREFMESFKPLEMKIWVK